jgi:hypothetical protein
MLNQLKSCLVWTVTLVLTAALFSGVVFAAADAPVIEAPWMTTAPVIDGKLAANEWSSAAKTEQMLILGTKDPAPQQTISWVGYNADYIFFAFDVTDNDITTTIKDHDGSVSRDDSVEIFLDTRLDNKYYHWLVNSIGVVRDIDDNLNAAWNGEHLVATSLTDKGYIVELAIPWKSLNMAGAPQAGSAMGLNLNRNDKPSPGALSWAYITGKSFHTPTEFGIVRFLAK